MELQADLVLEGGGVKGIALTGVVTGLAEAGYAFPRIAGSSAGAIVGCLVAALQRAGEPVARLAGIAEGLDYARVPDNTLPGLLAPFGQVASLLLTEGLHPGDYLLGYLRTALAELGVRTFGDLRIGGDELPVEERWSFVATASDLSGQRLVRLPWDAADVLGIAPDDLEVALAVRASASIPYFFRPVRVGGVTLVDGGLLSDFPVALFDAPAPRWPTFGVRLSARMGAHPAVHAATGNPLTFTVALLETLLASQDASYVDQRCVQARTVFVDTGDTSPIDFTISSERRAALVTRGRAAAQTFLGWWDYHAYLGECRSG